MGQLSCGPQAQESRLYPVLALPLTHKVCCINTFGPLPPLGCAPRLHPKVLKLWPSYPGLVSCLSQGWTLIPCPQVLLSSGRATQNRIFCQHQFGQLPSLGTPPLGHTLRWPAS